MDRITPGCSSGVDKSVATITTTPPLMDSSPMMGDPNDKDKDSDSISVSGSSYSGTSYMDDTLTNRAGGPARSAYVDPIVAEEEERQVKRSRLVVIAVLVVSLAILASTMYLVVSRGEHAAFEKQVSVTEFKLLCRLILWDEHPEYVPKASQNSPTAHVYSILVRSAPTTSY
jgi:hypothetical protein